MPTRCKLLCSSTGKQVYGIEILNTAKFSAIYDSDPNSENGRFFKGTPTATVELGLVNQAFEAGKAYYLDFTEADTIAASTVS